MGKSFAYSASRRAQLQKILGDRGEVLPRVARGSDEHPAAGWYARIGDEEVYLGDHFPLAIAALFKRAAA